MRVPTAHVYEPGSYAGNHDKYTTAHPGPLGHEDQGKTMLQSWQSFRLCCWIVFGSRESEMSLGGDDGNKHDINSSLW